MASTACGTDADRMMWRACGVTMQNRRWQAKRANAGVQPLAEGADIGRPKRQFTAVGRSKLHRFSQSVETPCWAACVLLIQLDMPQLETVALIKREDLFDLFAVGADQDVLDPLLLRRVQ
jgi:hypothetical protein